MFGELVPGPESEAIDGRQQVYNELLAAAKDSGSFEENVEHIHAELKMERKSFEDYVKGDGAGGSESILVSILEQTELPMVEKLQILTTCYERQLKSVENQLNSETQNHKYRYVDNLIKIKAVLERMK
jgi:hypothetical protein